MIASVSGYGFQRPIGPPADSLPAPQLPLPASGGSNGYQSIPPWSPPATSGLQVGRHPAFIQPVGPGVSTSFPKQPSVAAPASVAISQGTRTTSAGTSAYHVHQQFGPPTAVQQANKRPATYHDAAKQPVQQSTGNSYAAGPSNQIPQKWSTPSVNGASQPSSGTWIPSFGPNVPAVQNPSHSGTTHGYQQPSKQTTGNGVRAPSTQAQSSTPAANSYQIPKPSVAGSTNIPKTSKPAAAQPPKQTAGQTQPGSYQIPKPSVSAPSIPPAQSNTNTPLATSYQIPKPVAPSGPLTSSSANNYQSAKPLSAPGNSVPQTQNVAPTGHSYQTPKSPEVHVQKKPEAPSSQIPKPSSISSGASVTNKYQAPTNLIAPGTGSTAVGSRHQAATGSNSQSAKSSASSGNQGKQESPIGAGNSYQGSQSSASSFSTGGGSSENVGVFYQAPLPLASIEKPSWQQQDFSQFPIEEPVNIPESGPFTSAEDPLVAPAFEYSPEPSFFLEQPTIEPANLADQDPISFAIVQATSHETFPSETAIESHQPSSYGSSIEAGSLPLAQSFIESQHMESPSHQQWSSPESESPQTNGYGPFQEPSGPFQDSFDASFHSSHIVPPATSLQPPAFESASQYQQQQHLGSSVSPSNNVYHSSQPSFQSHGGATGNSSPKQQQHHQSIGGQQASKEIIAAATFNNQQVSSNRPSSSVNLGSQQSASNAKPPVASLSSESVLNVDGSFSYK